MYVPLVVVVPSIYCVPARYLATPATPQTTRSIPRAGRSPRYSPGTRQIPSFVGLRLQLASSLANWFLQLARRNFDMQPVMSGYFHLACTTTPLRRVDFFPSGS